MGTTNRKHVRLAKLPDYINKSKLQFEHGSDFLKELLAMKRHDVRENVAHVYLLVFQFEI